jgi:hypothetical protein
MNASLLARGHVDSELHFFILCHPQDDIDEL